MRLMSETADFFRSRLDQMIDLRRPLAVLSSRMPWQELEASVSHLFVKKVRLPPEHWQAYLNDPTLADAILDRILHSAHKLALADESMRKPEKNKP